MMPVAKLSVDRSFFRAILVLVSGTAAAHAITAVALPIATRLYSPAEFAVLSAFSGLAAIISVAACLRFDIAIPVTATDGEARAAFVLAVVCALAMSLSVAVVVALIPAQVLGRLGYQSLAPHLWILPFAVLFAASFAALQSWCVRRQQFKLVAQARVAQSAVASATQLGLGAAGLGPGGLILGHAANWAVGALILARSIRREETFREVDAPALRRVARTYDSFPKYSTLEALCNSAALQLPVILIASLAAGAEAGHLMLAMYVMQVPMVLIGSAVGQVYLSRAPEEHREGRITDFTIATLARLSIVGTGPLVCAAFVSPVAFTIIFGSEWRRAGEMVTAMTPWFIVQFLASPLSMVLHVMSSVRMALTLQVFGLVTRVGMVLATAAWAPSHVAAGYAASGFVFYVVYLAVLFVVVQAPLKSALRAIAAGWPHALAWAAAGAGAAWLLQVAMDGLGGAFR